MNIICLEHLSFCYGKNDILKDIDFSVKEGEFVTIIGPNGSGKTTLLRLLTGLLKGEGEIRIQDRPVEAYSHRELAKVVAVVHQNSYSQFPFSVREVVEMGRYAHIRKFSAETPLDSKAVEQAMKDTGILEFSDRLMSTLSGGEYQRTMIARALAQEPKILILDEPVNHLDLKYQFAILKLCKRLNRQKGMTILMVLHDVNLAAVFSDRILLLKDGKILGAGTPQEMIVKEKISEAYELDVEVEYLRGSDIPHIVPKVKLEDEV